MTIARASITISLTALLAAIGCSAPAPDEGARTQAQAQHGWGGNGSSSSSGSSSGGTTSDVVVACPNGADANAACSGGDHCCFTNYVASHPGYCSSDPCGYGTINCDGPEDCDAGEVCCARAIVDPVDGVVAYDASCTADACGASALQHELCHDACTTPGETCVSAAIADYDLPRALSVCQ